MPTNDLWPEEILSASELEGPTALLKQQAALLGQKTRNLVEAEVESVPLGSEVGQFFDSFVLYSPSINYRFTLFQVVYPLEFYPATVLWSGYGDRAEFNAYNLPAREANSQVDLESELRTIFSNEKTIRMIQALRARSRN